MGAQVYPRKDMFGRLTSESSCIPFILTSMGGLCDEGHDFLRHCKKRDKEATQHMIDVLVTQHARWTARRLRRALFGHDTFLTDTQNSCSVGTGTQALRRQRGKMRRLTEAFSHPSQPPVGAAVGPT